MLVATGDALQRIRTLLPSTLLPQRSTVEEVYFLVRSAPVGIVRTDRREDVNEGFVVLACCLIC